MRPMKRGAVSGEGISWIAYAILIKLGCSGSGRQCLRNLSVSERDVDWPCMLRLCQYARREMWKGHGLPPPRSLLVAAKFMHPLQFWASSLCFCDQCEFEPGC